MIRSSYFSGLDWLSVLLIVVTGVLALASRWMLLASWLEAIAFVSGALCVWLVVRENVWNFPIGILNVAVFFFVFAQSKLYADAGLQVVYALLNLYGWFLWLRGGPQDRELKISRVKQFEAGVLAIMLLLITTGLWFLLHRFGGSASFWDALTTALSLIAQWMLCRKQLENWVVWIVADIIYVPLYLYKELYLTALLYLVFLCMATIGWLQWRQRMRMGAHRDMTTDANG